MSDNKLNEEQCYREMVRDIRKWPVYKITACMNNSEVSGQILAERDEYLKTKDGKRMLSLIQQTQKLLDKQ